MKRGSQSIFLSALISIFCFALGAQGFEDNAACEGLVQTMRICACQQVHSAPVMTTSSTSLRLEVKNSEENFGYDVQALPADEDITRGCPCHGVHVKPTSTVRELCDDEKCRCLCSGGYSFAPTASVKKVSCDDCQMRGCPCHGLPSVQPTATSRSVEQLRDSGTDETSDEGTGEILEQVCDINPALAIIANINARIGSITDDACCDTVLGVLGNTCTLLGPDATISGTLSSFTTTFTLINEVIATLTACCAQMQVDFNTTWTTLNSTIATVTAECTQVQQSFVSTWTELNDVNNTITSCCASVAPEFANTWTQLAELLQTITTCQAAILAESGCDVLIYQSDIPYTITAPGLYCLVDSVNVTGGVAITIAASNVVLDLHKNVISGDVTSTCVLVNGRSTVRIENGSLETAAGIVSESTNSGVFQNLTFLNNANNAGVQDISGTLIDLHDVTFLNAGVSFLNSTFVHVRDANFSESSGACILCTNVTSGVIKNVQTNSSLEGLVLENSQAVVVSDIIATQNSEYGIFISSSTACYVTYATMDSNNIGMQVQNSQSIQSAYVAAANSSGLGFNFLDSNFISLDNSSDQTSGGIQLNGTAYAAITNFVGQQNTSFECIGSSTIVLENIALQESYMSISNGRAFTMKEVSVQDNGSTANGIAASFVNNILIKNCSSISNNDGISIENCAGVQLIGNECINNKNYGISIIRLSNGQVRSNRVLANDVGIYASSVSDVVYYNNLSTENTSLNDYVGPSYTISPSSMSFGRSTGYWINVST